MADTVREFLDSAANSQLAYPYIERQLQFV